MLRSCDVEVTGWASGRLNLLYLPVRPIEGPRRIDFSAWRCRHTLQPRRGRRIDRQPAVQRLGISRARSLGLEAMASAPGRLNLLYPPFGSLRGCTAHRYRARPDGGEWTAKNQRRRYSRLAVSDSWLAGPRALRAGGRRAGRRGGAGRGGCHRGVRSLCYGPGRAEHTRQRDRCNILLH